MVLVLVVGNGIWGCSSVGAFNDFIIFCSKEVVEANADADGDDDDDTDDTTIGVEVDDTKGVVADAGVGDESTVENRNPRTRTVVVKNID
mmetsp:Transcript_25452/g.28478  ORF Transcript_25452/g.28478 Transcript_25452/m.28478 type:complete len:90 (-) Transcript_25452:639-908(-)